MSIAFESIDYIREVSAMRYRTAMLNICLVLLIPLTVEAKKPEPETCRIEVAGPVSPGSVFEVVVRPAVGSGPWVSPTVDIEVSLPIISPPRLGTSPDTYSQTTSQTFTGGDRQFAKAAFIIPDPGYLDLDMQDSVEVFAMVSEPVNRGKSIESFCETVVSF